MKKISVVAVLILFFLTACTVQETMNPDLFIERFTDQFPEFSVDAEQMFYENEKCVVFLNNQGGRRFAMEMTVDSADVVQKISLACAETDKADDFYNLAESVVKVYAPDEDFKTASKKLFCGKKYSYYETQWYYYSFSESETGLIFCIENKRLSPEKEERLTLKENDIVTGNR